jgi:hypothetical protein
MPARELLSDTLVPAVDGDGNDVPGVHLPELTVPLATSAGWNTRHRDTGAPDQLADMAGSTWPFARDDGTRPAGDPRPSLASRYRDRADYESRVRAAAEALAAARYMLPEDVDRTVVAAGRLYERVAGAG